MTLAKDFACLQCKFQPTWRKFLCPLNPMQAAHLLFGVLRIFGTLMNGTEESHMTVLNCSD